MLLVRYTGDVRSEIGQPALGRINLLLVAPVQILSQKTLGYAAVMRQDLESILLPRSYIRHVQQNSAHRLRLWL